MSKFTRIGKLSPSEEDLLEQLVERRGMVRYGNRVRVSAMLELDVSLLLSVRSEQDGNSLSSVIGEVLRNAYAPILPALRLDGVLHCASPELEAKTLLESLSRHYGGFLTVSGARDSSMFSNYSELPWGGDDPDICPVILEETLHHLSSCVPKNSLIGYLRSDDGFFIDFDLDDDMGFLCLNDPMDAHILQVIQSGAIKIV